MVEIDAVHVEAFADLFDFSLVPRAALVENLEAEWAFFSFITTKRETVGF